MFRYSVIIPTYNEQDVIRETLSHLTRLHRNLEIIVVDGGSSDRTIEYASKYFVKIAHSPRGKGEQLNEGANTATGDILIFLHADTKLPTTAFKSIERLFSSTNTSITTFRLRFDKKNIATTIYSFFSRFDSIFTTFGDQAIICRKSFFYELNGFADYKVFEDVEFFSRARKLTKIRKIDSYVTTSARRYEKIGFIKTQLLNLWYIIRYLFTRNTDAIYKDYFMTDKFTNKKAVIVFVKYPGVGKVKTRLAETTGNEFALEFYDNCVRHTLAELNELSSDGTDIYIFYSGKDDSATVREWIGAEFHMLRQKGKSLGDKIADAFTSVFEKGYEKVAIVGSDVPDLSADILIEAFAKLDKVDAVVSPSPDGGYNLLAMKKFSALIFQGINWSTDTVLSETIDKFNSINYSYKLLRSLIDIDTEQDLINWLKSNGKSGLKKTIEKIYSRELSK